MHYYIDGYNMLFRLRHADDDLQSGREYIIYELNKKVSQVNLDVSLVFDGTFQLGERSRSHFNALEILFTAEGETADEFILEELKNSSNPHQKTVVTSDKKLAWWARRLSARTESVEDFLSWLNRSYKNKLKQAKKNKETILSLPPLVKPLTSPPKKVEQAINFSIPPSKATLEECAAYYERVFEVQFQELVKLEETRKLEKALSQPSSKNKMNKKKVPSNQISKESISDMERWLKTFEEKLNHSNLDEI